MLALVLASGAQAKSDEATSATLPIDRTNYFLGTQTFGVRYQFTEKTDLVETAVRIHEMGSNLLKFGMSRRTMGRLYDLPEREDIRTLADLATREPSVKTVLDMPFAYYHIWAYPLAHKESAWYDGFSERERKEEYEEIHDLAAHLLREYDGTGKTFFLGHWEGDWHLHIHNDQAARLPTARFKA